MSEELNLLPCPACGHERPALEDDDFSYVECVACGLTGPAYVKEGLREAAVEAWNSLPRKLRWTKEKPTDGWYWLRRPGKMPEVVNVDRGRYVSGKSYGAPLSNEEFDDAEWAGPIQAPMEENK